MDTASICHSAPVFYFLGITDDSLDKLNLRSINPDKEMLHRVATCSFLDDPNVSSPPYHACKCSTNGLASVTSLSHSRVTTPPPDKIKCDGCQCESEELRQIAEWEGKFREGIDVQQSFADMRLIISRQQLHLARRSKAQSEKYFEMMSKLREKYASVTDKLIVENLGCQGCYKTRENDSDLQHPSVIVSESKVITTDPSVAKDAIKVSVETALSSGEKDKIPNTASSSPSSSNPSSQRVSLSFTPLDRILRGSSPVSSRDSTSSSTSSSQAPPQDSFTSYLRWLGKQPTLSLFHYRPSYAPEQEKQVEGLLGRLRQMPIMAVQRNDAPYYVTQDVRHFVVWSSIPFDTDHTISEDNDDYGRSIDTNDETDKDNDDTHDDMSSETKSSMYTQRKTELLSLRDYSSTKAKETPINPPLAHILQRLCVDAYLPYSVDPLWSDSFLRSLPLAIPSSPSSSSSTINTIKDISPISYLIYTYLSQSLSTTLGQDILALVTKYTKALSSTSPSSPSSTCSSSPCGPLPLPSYPPSLPPTLPPHLRGLFSGVLRLALLYSKRHILLTFHSLAQHHAQLGQQSNNEHEQSSSPRPPTSTPSTSKRVIGYEWLSSYKDQLSQRYQLLNTLSPWLLPRYLRPGVWDYIKSNMNTNINTAINTRTNADTNTDINMTTGRTNTPPSASLSVLPTSSDSVNAIISPLPPNLAPFTEFALDYPLDDPLYLAPSNNSNTCNNGNKNLHSTSIITEDDRLLLYTGLRSAQLLSIQSTLSRISKDVTANQYNSQNTSHVNTDSNTDIKIDSSTHTNTDINTDSNTSANTLWQSEANACDHAISRLQLILRHIHDTLLSAIEKDSTSSETPSPSSSAQSSSSSPPPLCLSDPFLATIWSKIWIEEACHDVYDSAISWYDLEQTMGDIVYDICKQLCMDNTCNISSTNMTSNIVSIPGTLLPNSAPSPHHLLFPGQSIRCWSRGIYLNPTHLRSILSLHHTQLFASRHPKYLPPPSPSSSPSSLSSSSSSLSSSLFVPLRAHLGCKDKSIPCLSAQSITCHEFIHKYVNKNQPLLVNNAVHLDGATTSSSITCFMGKLRPNTRYPDHSDQSPSTSSSSETVSSYTPDSLLSLLPHVLFTNVFVTKDGSFTYFKPPPSSSSTSSESTSSIPTSPSNGVLPHLSICGYSDQTTTSTTTGSSPSSSSSPSSPPSNPSICARVTMTYQEFLGRSRLSQFIRNHRNSTYSQYIQSSRSRPSDSNSSSIPSSDSNTTCNDNLPPSSIPSLHYQSITPLLSPSLFIDSNTGERTSYVRVSSPPSSLLLHQSSNDISTTSTSTPSTKAPVLCGSVCSPILSPDEHLYIYGESLPIDPFVTSPRFKLNTSSSSLSTNSSPTNTPDASSNITKTSLQSFCSSLSILPNLLPSLHSTPGYELTSSLLWVGVDGQFSPLHFDLAETIITQLSGTKRVLLFPPSVSHLLSPYPVTHPRDRQSQLNPTAPCPLHASARSSLAITSPTSPSPSSSSHSPVSHSPAPRSTSSCLCNVSAYEVAIQEGDALYIPYGWWHHVLSSGDTVSVTFRFNPYVDKVKLGMSLRRKLFPIATGSSVTLERDQIRRKIAAYTNAFITVGLPEHVAQIWGDRVYQLESSTNT